MSLLMIASLFAGLLIQDADAARRARGGDAGEETEQAPDQVRAEATAQAAPTAAPARATPAPAPATNTVGPVPVERAEPPPALYSPGSIWRDTSGRELLGLQGNNRQVGDLVTVVIQEQSSSDLGATTSSTKSNSRSGEVGSLFGLETGVLSANANMGGNLGFEVGGEAAFTGGGNTTATATVQAVVTCYILEVLPNGNLVIEGTKQVRNYRETQHVSVYGIVRPQDIRMDNSVSSQFLGNAIIEVYGQGSIADRNRPGVGTRMLDVAWPF